MGDMNKIKFILGVHTHEHEQTQLVSTPLHMNKNKVSSMSLCFYK